MAASPLSMMATAGPHMCYPFSQGTLLAFSTNNLTTARQRYVAPNTIKVTQWILHATPPSARAPIAPYHQTMRGRRPINASPIHNIRYSDFLNLVKQRRIEKVS